jgi:anion-transporting  ArsA/GET3 family ATPase
MTLLDRDLIYVTGKGGVGRSTVSGALGLVTAERGRRTILCEVAEQDRLSRAFGKRDRIDDEETELADGLWGISIDPWAALRDWLAGQLGSRMLSRVLFDNNAFRYFAAAAPGAREMATIVKVWGADPGRL